MRRVWLWMVLLSSAGMLFADTSRDWDASVYAGVTDQSGNTREESYRYGAEFEKKNGRANRYYLKGDGRYRKTDDVISESKAEVEGEMRRMLGERLFASGTLAVIHDDAKEISYRARIGPGIGYYLVDQEALTADVSTGVLYVREQAAGLSEDYLAWRLSQWFDRRFSDRLRGWFGTEWFVNTGDAADWLLIFRAGVESKINSHFSLILVAENEYDHQPENENLKENDFEFSAGLRYTF